MRRFASRWTRTKGVLLFASALALAGCSSKTPEGKSSPSPTPTSPWAALASAPFPNDSVLSAVWTGKEMILWGGSGSTKREIGAVYDPAARTWGEIPSSGLSARTRAGVAWTGNELIVWGGQNFAKEGERFRLFADGAAYDTAKSTWRKIAGSPLSGRGDSRAVWTGSQVIFWSGFVDGGDAGDGAAYDPKANRWSNLGKAPLEGASAHLFWTGNRVLVWLSESTGEREDLAGKRSFAAYDPASRTWELLPRAPLHSRSGTAVVWTGKEMIAWGGEAFGAESGYVFSDGAAYDPATRRWRSLPQSPLSARSHAFAAWTGDRMLVWGGWTQWVTGMGAAAPVVDGAAYDPATDSWSSLEPLLSARTKAGSIGAAFWTGEQVIVWGGTQSATGLAYTPR